MKKKWFAYGCLTSILILIITLILVFNGIKGYMNSFKPEKKVLQADTWLVISLQNQINEYNELSEDFWGNNQNSAHSYIMKINQAANDVNIKGIILLPEFFSSGYSTVNRVRLALENFKASGKPVYAYLNTVSNRGYYLAAVADKIYLNPSASAGILLTGIGGHVLYYKDLMDKLGVDMQVIHAGKYKAAGEQFVRNDMSPEFRENLESLYGDLYSQMISTIADSRNIAENELKGIYEKRDEIWINGGFALDSGLADELLTYEVFLNSLNINSNDIERNLMTISEYTLHKKLTENNKIAVIYAQGSIMKQSEPAFNVISAAKIKKILETIEKDASVKAVVLRVNSPGGSALESEIILNQIKNMQSRIPVVVSMGDVAASGGYYISCSADYIVADPMCITGSIGVVGMFPNLSKMGNKIGVHASSIEFGQYSDLLNLWEEPDENEMTAIKNSILQVYDEFKLRVSEGRDIPLDKVEEIAQGRVWSSNQALEFGLIDAVGNLDEAAFKAAELAGITDFQLVYYPEQKTLLDFLLQEYFDLDMATKLISKNLQDISLGTEFDRLKAIKEDPRQAYCPVNIK